ncbi:DUF3440 domain-containing protein [Paenibacillus enshidis]|uniref:DUF3440 domain-containing protein n=1 Tax=Paenibacillus enshidis TaxID=1458439 RepID=A0ABV5AZC1_9BACL
MYRDIHVYDALQERLAFIFEEFDNIYMSFSGGKDSGLLLNAVMDYKHRHGIDKRIGLFHQDFEAQYQLTTEYVQRTFDTYAADMDAYWVCLPIACKTPLSNYEIYWHPWDPDKQDIWVREMPKGSYVINLDNNPFDFYTRNMDQEDLYRQFGRWYHQQCGGGKTIGLVGLRADESLHRYSAIVNKRDGYDGRKWITKQFSGVWSASPIYDWTVRDIWAGNGKHGYDYNRLYDLYYKAGLSLEDMRVASPFNEWAKTSLNIYRVIEPQTWAKLVGRVQGANFTAIYGGTKAMAYREITLPPGHTWKSYTEFLLSTLPPEIRDNYLAKFKTSLEFWAKTGGGFAEEVIKEIEECGYRIRRNGVSNYTKDQKTRIVFDGEAPDHTDDVKGTIDIPSWKRMCICILKNDHMCRHMGFGPNKEQKQKIELLRQKYKNI